MAPVRDYFNGAIRIIRPLMYVPEAELKRFSNAHEFPSPPPECPRGEHSHRKLMKDVLLQMKKDCRKVTSNLVRSALSKPL
jgi:tRNA(Ile)-lysidine synthase TilS/MesJ